MDIAFKIFYTWVVLMIPFGLLVMKIDVDEHPRIASVLLALIWLPLVLGIIALFVILIANIWK